jgi:serine/threonine protein kinase
VLSKEFLFIVTDYQPFTISDLRVIPSTYMMDISFESSPSSVRNYCLESIKQVMLGVFQGLRDLHSIGITHRDIKLCNILIDND